MSPFYVVVAVLLLTCSVNQSSSASIWEEIGLGNVQPKTEEYQQPSNPEEDDPYYVPIPGDIRRADIVPEKMPFEGVSFRDMAINALAASRSAGMSAARTAGTAGMSAARTAGTAGMSAARTAGTAGYGAIKSTAEYVQKTVELEKLLASYLNLDISAVKNIVDVLRSEAGVLKNIFSGEVWGFLKALAIDRNPELAKSLMKGFTSNHFLQKDFKAYNELDGSGTGYVMRVKIPILNIEMTVKCVYYYEESKIVIYKNDKVVDSISVLEDLKKKAINYLENKADDGMCIGIGVTGIEICLRFSAYHPVFGERKNMVLFSVFTRYLTKPMSSPPMLIGWLKLKKLTQSYLLLDEIFYVWKDMTRKLRSTCWKDHTINSEEIYEWQYLTNIIGTTAGIRLPSDPEGKKGGLQFLQTALPELMHYTQTNRNYDLSQFFDPPRDEEDILYVEN